MFILLFIQDLNKLPVQWLTFPPGIKILQEIHLPTITTLGDTVPDSSVPTGRARFDDRRISQSNQKTSKNNMVVEEGDGGNLPVIQNS